MAASTYLEARTSGSFKGRNLSRYRDFLTPIYEDVNRSGRDSFISESSITYHTLPRAVFTTRILSSVYKFKPRDETSPPKDNLVLVKEATNLSEFDLDEAYSHIKVDIQLASKSVSKPWVPACPTGCFAISTSKGVFVSFEDLYEVNLNDNDGNRGKALSETLTEIASAQLRFDQGTCVDCGNCGTIGPKEMVDFGHEREGHGVQYKFG
jgi:electron transfer flavoprotein-quinone oxidoreductase